MIKYASIVGLAAAGWLASTLTGPVSGAAVGGATGGGTLISIRNVDGRAGEIEAALDSFRAADMRETGERDRASGWKGHEKA